MTLSTSPKSDTSSESGTVHGRDALASLRIERPSPGDSRGSGRKWMILIALLLLIGGGYIGLQYGGRMESIFGDRATWIPEVMQNRVEVRLANVTVQKGRAADAVVVATGYLESRRQAKIGARAAGRIDAVFFEEGDKVARDELLAELDHKDMDAALAAATASVTRAKAALGEQRILIAQAKADLVRAERLKQSQSLAESEYDRVRFAYQTAIAREQSLNAEVALAEAQELQSERIRENMFIHAPFAGTVISADAEEGESIMPGGTGGTFGRGSVATIADLDNLEIECDVQEDFISRVTEGQEADIAVDAVPNKKYHGTVRKIIPMGDRARATIKVKVQIRDADDLLFPEMAGTVYFLPTKQDMDIKDEPRLFCPTSAVDRDDQGNQFVWVVDSEKRAKKMAVTVGEDRDGRTEILKGLVGRERVVVNPEDLHAGTPVQVAE